MVPRWQGQRDHLRECCRVALEDCVRPNELRVGAAPRATYGERELRQSAETADGADRDTGYSEGEPALLLPYPNGR